MTPTVVNGIRYLVRAFLNDIIERILLEERDELRPDRNGHLAVATGWVAGNSENGRREEVTLAALD